MNAYLSILIDNNLYIQSKNLDITRSSLIKFKQKDCKHIITGKTESVLQNIKRNGVYKCPDCKKEETKLSFEEVKKRVLNSTQKEYKVISLKKDYINTRNKINILHKTCGDITPITYKNFSLGKRCKHCAAKTTNSKASQLLSRLLKQVNIDFEDEKTFDTCRNPMTGYKLPFDFYIEKLNLLIEIDGSQHFKSVKRFGGDDGLKGTKYRDFIKDKFCIQNKIKLKRISLLDFKKNKDIKFDDIKVIIFNLLNDIALDYYKET